MEVCSLDNSAKYQVKYHNKSVTSLKYAHKKDWFVTTGQDQLVNLWKNPYGANIYNVSFFFDIQEHSLQSL